MHHEVCCAIDLRIGLRETLRDWRAIRDGLAESRRKRRPQIEALQTS
jgi:hypothetical protein